MFSTIFCRAGFQPRRTGDDLRADLRRDGHVAQGLQKRMRVGAQADGNASARPGPAQRRQHIRRAAAGGDADDRVVRADGQAVHQRLALGFIVLAALHGLAQRPVAPGDIPLHLFRLDAEGGRAFGSVQHAQAAGGARAQINQPSAAPEAGVDEVDGLRDARALRAHGLRDLRVLPVHQRDHFPGGTQIDIARGLAYAFRGQPCQIRIHPAPQLPSHAYCRHAKRIAFPSVCQFHFREIFSVYEIVFHQGWTFPRRFAMMKQRGRVRELYAVH